RASQAAKPIGARAQTRFDGWVVSLPVAAAPAQAVVGTDRLSNVVAAATMVVALASRWRSFMAPRVPCLAGRHLSPVPRFEAAKSCAMAPPGGSPGDPVPVRHGLSRRARSRPASRSLSGPVGYTHPGESPDTAGGAGPT